MAPGVRSSRVFLLWVVVAAVGLSIAYTVGQRHDADALPSERIPAAATKDFGLMAEAWNSIHERYVDRSAIQPENLTYGAISGMVDSLGDTGHSTFLTPQMIEEEKEQIKGEYVGIGAEVRMKDGHVVIVAPFDGSPAQKAGLKPGDIIVRVDSDEVTGLSLFQVVKKIAGPKGTPVSLTILSPGSGATRTVTMTRAPVMIHNVTWVRLPGTRVAHLRVASFSDGVTKNLVAALKSIGSAKLDGLILDLRNNPGGLLDEAVATASQFLATGNVLLEKNVKGAISPVPVEKGGAALHIKMAVLVNGGTASGAEIVAGALQDAKRAPLIGTTTFGTGTVLQQFPLSDGSALLLAVEEWLTPDGHTIWHHGITPTTVVHLPGGVAPSFPESERSMTVVQLEASGDRQLLDALHAVTGQGR